MGLVPLKPEAKAPNIQTPSRRTKALPAIDIRTGRSIPSDAKAIATGANAE